MLLAGCEILTLCGCSKAGLTQGGKASEPDLILSYAENQPEDYPTIKAANAFANMVSERTDGHVKIKVYSGGEMGAELSVIQQMTFGGIDFSRVSLSQLAESIPELNILQLPFLYTDAAHMWRVLDGQIGDEFLMLLSSINLTGLSWFDAGARSFYTRSRVSTLAELAGLTIRVQESELMSEMAQLLGTVPSQVTYSDVYAALHNGLIDGAENNWPSYEAMGHYEVASYFLRDEHTRVPEIQIASEAAMEKLAALNSSYPQIIRQCAKESAVIERELWAQKETDAEQNLRALGVEVIELSDNEKQKFRSAIQPIYDEYAAQSNRIEKIQHT